ncbi:hypothetical protein V9T40_012422 [Parthenolecanium corni]|uniref:Ornithine decarboxylase antizyme n=1 Tax=Parthenolecanium corni TaxID=536013 RepID=A0AAN9XZ35_9HEMI
MNKTSSNRNNCSDESSIYNGKESIFVSGSLRNDVAFVRDVPEVLASDCGADQQGLCGAPEAPHVACIIREGCDREGGLVFLSEKKGSRLLSRVDIDHLLETSEKCAAQITFKLQITRDSDVTWESILFQQNLYIRIDGSNPAISKMGFLGIMEYAEDVLKVKRIIVCFGRNNPIRELLVRTFMYIGFCLIPPGHKLIPRASSDTSNIYMAYCTD